MHDHQPVDCIWKPLSDGVWACMKCKTPPSTRKKYAETPPRRNCKGPPRTQRCQHLGQPTGFVECETCNGNVRLKVFECDVHGQCTVAKKMNGLVCCSSCPDYLPHRDDADEHGSAAG